MSYVQSLTLYPFEYDETVISGSRPAASYTNGNRDETYISGVYWLPTSSVSQGRWKSTNSTLISKNGSEVWIRPDGKGELKTLNSGTITTEYVMEPVSGSLWHNIYSHSFEKSRGVVDNIIYTTKSYPGFDNFVRNPSLWMAGVKGLTAISPWNSSGVGSFGQQGATAISPRHIVSAYHAPTGLVTVGWVALDNTLVTRSVVQQARAGSTDIMVGILDSDLPANIDYLRTMPDHDIMTASLASLITGSQLIIGCASNQTSRLSAVDIWYSAGGTVIFHEDSSVWVSSSLGYNTGIGGDSGRPIVVLIDNELILWSQFTGATAGPEYAWPSVRNAVDSAMSSLSLAQSAPIYTMETRSFEEFTKYQYA